MHSAHRLERFLHIKWVGAAAEMKTGEPAAPVWWRPKVQQYYPPESQHRPIRGYVTTAWTRFDVQFNKSTVDLK